MRNKTVSQLLVKDKMCFILRIRFFYFLYRKEGLFVESIQGSAVNDFEAKVKQTFKKHHEIAD